MKLKWNWKKETVFDLKSQLSELSQEELDTIYFGGLPTNPLLIQLSELGIIATDYPIWSMDYNGDLLVGDNDTESLKEHLEYIYGR